MDETDVRDRLLELKVIQERLRAFHSERGPSHQKRLDNPVLLPRTYAGAEPIRYAHHLTSEHSAMLRHVAPGDLIDTSGPFGKACDAFYELSRQVSETLEAGRDREALQALQEVRFASNARKTHD